eukprot:g1320.t1
MSSRSTRSGGGGGGARGTKRPRTDDGHQPDQFKRDDDDDGSQTHQQPNNNNNQPRGRPQLLLNTDELRKRTGKKYCDEAELVPLLLAHGLIRRVRTIAVEVRPLSGESFDIKLNAKAPTVGEAKEQIERDEGTKPRSQLLCRVQVSSDGSNVREFDQEPEELKEDGMALEEGDVIAMGVMPEPVQWRTFPADRVAVSEEGKLATRTANGVALVTTGEELTEGRHYWELELIGSIDTTLGVCKPGLDPKDYHFSTDSMWSMYAADGTLWGNGKRHSDRAGPGFDQGDRMGILLDLDGGSLRFFKNGAEHGPGYPAGSVAGPVARAVQQFSAGQALRLLPNAAWPAVH